MTNLTQESPESTNVIDLQNAIARILERLERLEARNEGAREAELEPQEEMLAAQNRAEPLPPLEKYVPRADYESALNRIQDMERSNFLRRIDKVLEGAREKGKIVPANEAYYRAMCRAESDVDALEEFLIYAPTIVEFRELTAPAPNTPSDSAREEFSLNRSIRDEFGTLERYTAFCRAQDAGLTGKERA